MVNPIFALNMRLDVYTQTEPESCKIIIHFADISFATTYGLFAEAIWIKICSRHLFEERIYTASVYIFCWIVRRRPFSGLTQWAHWSFTQYLQCSNNLNILFHGVVSNLHIYTITCCTFILVHWTNKLTEIFFSLYLFNSWGNLSTLVCIPLFQHVNGTLVSYNVRLSENKIQLYV